MPGRIGGTRTCRRCHQTFPATRDYFHRSGEGLEAVCRPCCAIRGREQRARARERGPSTRQRRSSGSGTAPTSRIFGVEMELTGPSSSTIIRELMAAGVSMSQRNRESGASMGYQATNTSSDVWSLKHDGSVRGEGLELVSPKLRGPAGFGALETVCRVLNEQDASVDASCGLHVHHDMRGLGVESIKRQVLAFVERQDTIAGFVAPSRRNNGYCHRWQPMHLQALQQRVLTTSSIGGVGPRGFINLQAYPIHGSVEVRAHAGTTNYRKIAAWVRFGQALFAGAEARAEMSTDSHEQLLADLIPFGLQQEDVGWLMRFQAIGESRSAIRERVLALRESITQAESVFEEVPA